MRLWSYMLAGRAVFTVQSHKTGTRYTFRINRLDPNKIRGNARSLHFVDYLAGPDNTSDYVPCATIFDEARLSPRAGSEHRVYKAFEWVFNSCRTLARTGSDRDVLPNCDFIMSGRCCRCARLLTTPESVARGIGPECADKVAGFC